jgi:hypothetical protein
MTGSRERPSPARRFAFRHRAAGGRFDLAARISGNIPPLQPFGESGAIGWPSKPSLSAARLEIPREQTINDAARDEIRGIDGCALETTVLDEHERACAERARESGARLSEVKSQLSGSAALRAIALSDQTGTLCSLKAPKIAEREVASVNVGLRLRSAWPNCAIAMSAIACAARSS